MGRLYLCATPLGNLDDITLRALEVLKQVDLVAAEDTRHTRKLLDHYGITTKTTSYHQHNERGKASSLLAELDKGKEIALVSDAGTPGVSDPGYILVQQALEAGHQVTVLPGPSAVIAALVISGFKPYPFYFFGFLPRKKGERRQQLKEQEENPWTGVYYEAPHRLQETLQDFCDIWGAERRVAVARELTKHFEEVFRGSFASALEHFSAAPPKGEITLVVEGKTETTADPLSVDSELVKEAVTALIRAGSDLHQACRAVGKALDLSKSQVYRLYHG
ncbi:MAG TPA: 16S rRNA (cytidine(1402)-2'-O)-methyltransferase [Syntrophomonadaceae bacterium]|nr:16S rRNA (cytidine(1402)-2'-O)-methyltransferase [Syntrophomonadaceae bacterium]